MIYLNIYKRHKYVAYMSVYLISHQQLGSIGTRPQLKSHQSRYQSKKKGKIKETIQSNITPDPGYQWESNKLTIRHHKREPRGQPFPSR